MSTALKVLAKSETVVEEKKPKNVAYYAPFIRVSQDEQIVEGIASSEAVDSYGDIVRVTAIEDALPDYMKYANLRSMHSNIAAGTVIETKIDKTNKIFYITAKVVDKAEWEKVKETVYKGFSIGGVIEDWEPIMVEVPDQDGNMHEVFTGGFEITKLKLIEISLVDRPANPDALISAYKAAKLRKFDTKDGEVEQEESFVPSVVLQPNLTKIGKEVDTNSRPSSMKTLKKSNPLSILAPRTMSQKITKAQMQKVADDAIKAALKAAGITDTSMDELQTLSRGDIVDAAKELVAEVVDGLAVLVKAEGTETSEGADQVEEVKTEEVVTEETKEASEDEITATEEKETSEEVVEEEKTEEVAAVVTEEETKTEEVKETTEEVVAEKSAETSAIVEAIKSLGATIQKSNEDTVAEIKKSNKAVAEKFDTFAKKAGASVQTDEAEVEESVEETSTEGAKTAFAKSDPWGKRIA